MRTIPLDQDARGTANASGTATVQIGPNRSGQRWRVSSLSVSTSIADSCTAQVFSPMGVFIGGTFTGSQDTTDLDVELNFGSRLKVIWSGATPGNACTVGVSGTIEVG